GNGNTVGWSCWLRSGRPFLPSLAVLYARQTQQGRASVGGGKKPQHRRCQFVGITAGNTPASALRPHTAPDTGGRPYPAPAAPYCWIKTQSSDGSSLPAGSCASGRSEACCR